MFSATKPAIFTGSLQMKRWCNIVQPLQVHLLHLSYDLRNNIYRLSTPSFQQSVPREAFRPQAKKCVKDKFGTREIRHGTGAV